MPYVDFICSLEKDEGEMLLLIAEVNKHSNGNVFCDYISIIQW